MGVECMSLITIINKPLPAQGLALIVGGYNFRYARKRAGFIRNRVAEIYQEVAVVRRELFAADGDR